MASVEGATECRRPRRAQGLSGKFAAEIKHEVWSREKWCSLDCQYLVKLSYSVCGHPSARPSVSPCGQSVMTYTVCEFALDYQRLKYIMYVCKQLVSSHICSTKSTNSQGFVWGRYLIRIKVCRLALFARIIVQCTRTCWSSLKPQSNKHLEWTSKIRGLWIKGRTRAERSRTKIGELFRSEEIHARRLVYYHKTGYMAGM